MAIVKRFHAKKEKKTIKIAHTRRYMSSKRGCVNNRLRIEGHSRKTTELASSCRDVLNELDRRERGIKIMKVLPLLNDPHFRYSFSSFVLSLDENLWSISSLKCCFYPRRHIEGHRRAQPIIYKSSTAEHFYEGKTFALSLLRPVSGRIHFRKGKKKKKTF